MAQARKHSAGDTRKSHKSRKTSADTSKDQGPSSPAPATVGQAEADGTLPAPPSANTALVDALGGSDKKEGAAISTGIPAEEPAKQWWVRPKDSKTRKQAEQVAIQRAAGRSDKEIAKRMKTSEGVIRQIAYIARKNGWWDTEDEPIDLEEELALTIDRKVVRNVSAALDGQMTNWQTHEMTMAAAKGRGIFRNHEASKGEEGPAMTVVAIKIEMPPLGAGDQAAVVDANCGGVPAYVEGEVADQKALPATAGE